MDYTVFRSINQFAGHYDRRDDVIEIISRYGPFLLIAMLVGLWFWPGTLPDRDRRQWACMVAALSAAIALGINQVIIRIWQRPRPFTDHHVALLLKPSQDPSFPSDHATFAAAVAVAILLASRKAGIAAVGIAVMIGLSRVYVGEHYLGDVIAGALIGGVTAWSVYQLQPLAQPYIDPPMRLVRRLHLG